MSVEEDEDFFQTRKRNERKQKQHQSGKHHSGDDKKHEEKVKKDGKQDQQEKEKNNSLQGNEKLNAPAKASFVPGKDNKNKKKLKEIGKPAELVTKTIGHPNFLVHDNTPSDISKSDQETIENKVRRWQIFISEIKLENLQKDDLSVFLNFRLGQIGKNKQLFQDVSSGEIFFKSEIAKDVKRSEVKPVKVTFTCEMHLSYQMLRERYLVIEVWSYRAFLLNLFLGMIRVPLIDIVSGPMARFNNIKQATGEKRQFARIYYKIMFQEVWDYKLTFEAWKASNLMGERGKDLTPKLELTLMTEDEPSVRSEVQKATKNPNFKDLEGYIHYRGTMESLTEQMLLITIYSNMFSTYCKKLVSLRGIQDSNYLKSQFRLKLKKPPNYKAIIQKEIHKKANMNDDDYDSDGVENEDDMLQDKSIYCVVEGRINLNKTPRFMQVGELNRYIPGEYYLVIIINRLEKVLSPDDRGVINTFLTVSWRDQQKITQIMRDNSNPTYNEELYFKMPILEPEFDILNQKTKEQLINDAISEELRNRPDINIQLWLDGADIMTDESLGNCKVFISEIAKAQKQPKIIVTEDNRRKTFETRIQTFKKKFTSGLFNLSPITVHFQACFIPDLPEEIDISDFNSVPPDFFPIEIADQMELKDDWRKTNQIFRDWQYRIQNTFKAYGGIQKNAYALFFNSIFVKDQFDNLHLVCKYLEKFYVRYQSQEGTRELFANPNDIAVRTLHELVHFVRNIPFIGDSFSKREVWMSPDFMLKIRKGFPHDHAVLAACLFLGCELEDQQSLQEKWKEYVPLEHRTFVCLGTSKPNGNQHAWVMTFSYSFDRLTFWDIQDNKHFELVGRVHKKQIKKLRKYIYPEYTPQKQQKNYLAMFETKKKMSKKELKREERRRKKQQLEIENNKKKKEQETREKKLKESEDLARKKEREFAKFQSDNMEILDSDVIALNTISLTHTKVKNERQMGNDPLLEKSRRDKDKPQLGKSQPEQTTEKKKFQNPFATQTTQKSGALTKRQQEQEEKRAGQSDAIFSKREDFGNVEDVELPYETIEVIFNQKNIWGNLGNQNPAEIFYHLHDSKYWLPFITYEKIVKEGDDDDDDDDDDDEEDDDDDNLLDNSTNIVKTSWMSKVGSFYGAQILSEPIRKDKIKRLIEDIYYEVKGGIVKARAKLGFATKWKHELDALNKKMLELLQILEYRDTNRPLRIIKKTYEDDKENPENKLQVLNETEVDSRDYKFIMEQWQMEVKRLIPKGCKFEGLPMRFTFTQSEKMRTIIVENMASFFMVEHKKVIFNLIGRIYNYPNKVCCVRLLLGYTYSQSEEVEKNNDEEEEASEGEDPKQSGQPLLSKIDEEDEDQSKPLLGKK